MEVKKEVEEQMSKVEGQLKEKYEPSWPEETEVPRKPKEERSVNSERINRAKRKTKRERRMSKEREDRRPGGGGGRLREMRGKCIYLV